MLSDLVFPRLLRLESAQEPQGKYMHHTHVHDDLLLMYILFARRTHEHEGTFLVSKSFAMMHIAKIHVTHWLLCHDYALT